MTPALHIETFWPTSLVTLLSVVVMLITAIGYFYDKLTGKGRTTANLGNKIDGLCRQVEDMEGDLKVVDGLAVSVRELVFEWRGVDGNNGYKSIIRDNQRRLNDMDKRNWQIDAVREAHEADLRRSGGMQRRESDRPLNNLLPEEREEKG